MLDGITLIVVALVGALFYLGVMNWSIRRRALLRLYALDDSAALPAQDTSRDSALGRWLARAGYRQQNAQTVFIAATAGCVLVGLAVSQFYRLVLLRRLLNAIANVPGSAGELMALVLISGPWILLMVSGFVPTLAVRATRRTPFPPPTRKRSRSRDPCRPARAGTFYSESPA